VTSDMSTQTWPSERLSRALATLSTPLLSVPKSERFAQLGLQITQASSHLRALGLASISTGSAIRNVASLMEKQSRDRAMQSQPGKSQKRLEDECESD
jgi:hypothetical protein